MTLPRYFRHTPELPSCFRGIPMGFLWASMGFQCHFGWISQFSLDLRVPVGLPEGLPWDVHLTPEFSVDLCGASTGLSVSHGASIDFAWEFNETYG